VQNEFKKKRGLFFIFLREGWQRPARTEWYIRAGKARRNEDWERTARPRGGKKIRPGANFQIRPAGARHKLVKKNIFV
jgi:hypothetical protein